MGLAPRQPPPAPSPLPLVAEPQHGHLTPRGTAWLVLRRPETRTLDEEQHLALLTAQQAELAEAVRLARARHGQCRSGLAAFCARAARRLCRRQSGGDRAVE